MSRRVSYVLNLFQIEFKMMASNDQPRKWIYIRPWVTYTSSHRWQALETYLCRDSFPGINKSHALKYLRPNVRGDVRFGIRKVGWYLDNPPKVGLELENTCLPTGNTRGPKLLRSPCSYRI